MDVNFNEIILHIDGLVEGIFKNRPNRYLAEVEVQGEPQIVHVHDPGRLKELLFSENKCLIRSVTNPNRKTKWDMIMARKCSEWVLIHSGYHRYLAEEIINNEYSPFGKVEKFKAEVKLEHSRIDFKAETEDGNTLWIEVKGCSLSEDGIAKFPDAPTERGRRHLETLIMRKKNYPSERVAVLILVLSKSKIFEPNYKTDPKFYKVFYNALDEGVEVYPCQICYDENSHTFNYQGILPIQRCNLDYFKV